MPRVVQAARAARRRVLQGLERDPRAQVEVARQETVQIEEALVDSARGDRLLVKVRVLAAMQIIAVCRLHPALVGLRFSCAT